MSLSSSDSLNGASNNSLIPADEDTPYSSFTSPSGYASYRKEAPTPASDHFYTSAIQFNSNINSIPSAYSKEEGLNPSISGIIAETSGDLAPLTLECTENITAADFVTDEFTASRVINEAITLDSIGNFTTTRFFDEAVTLGSSLDISFSKNIGESLKISDTFNRLADYIRTETEILPISDTVAKLFVKKGFEESFTVISVLDDFNIGKGLSEPLVLSHDFNRTASYIRYYDETFTIGQPLGKNITKSPFLNSLIISEMKIPAFYKNCIEPLAFADNIIKDFDKNITELIDIADLIPKFGKIFLEETFTGYDGRTNKLNKSLVAEELQWVENFTKSFTKALTSELYFEDIFTRKVDYYIFPHELVILADPVEKIFTKAPFQENLAANTSSTKLFNKNLEEECFPEDSLDREAGYLRVYEDSALLGDIIAKAFQKPPFAEYFYTDDITSYSINKSLGEILYTDDLFSRSAKFKLYLKENGFSIKENPIYIAKVIRLLEKLGLGDTDSWVCYQTLLENCITGDLSDNQAEKLLNEFINLNSDSLAPGHTTSWRSHVEEFSVFMGITMLLVVALNVRRKLPNKITKFLH